MNRAKRRKVLKGKIRNKAIARRIYPYHTDLQLNNIGVAKRGPDDYIKIK